MNVLLSDAGAVSQSLSAPFGKTTTIGDQQPATSNQQPATSNQQPATSNRR